MKRIPIINAQTVQLSLQKCETLSDPKDVSDASAEDAEDT
jgi:hypothetical protein